MGERTLVRILLVTLVALQTACVTNRISVSATEQAPLTFDTQLFGARPDIVDAAEVFTLRERHQREFLAFYRDPNRQSTPPHERIYDFLLVATEDFDFHNDTRTAAEALDNASGNCLSLAILTTALADLVGVETAYQLVDSTPVFERRGSIVSKGIHVRSILYDPTWRPASKGGQSSVRPGIRFDYFPEATERARVIGNLSPAAYVAMYYSNVAGEAIASGDIETAFWYLLKSLEQEPENATALNMLGIVYRKAGDEVMAEKIYRFGIESLPDNASFLRNYHFLLTRQGRNAEAAEIQQSLAKLDDRNPFNWVNAGRSAIADGENREAIRYFQRALAIAPYLHEAHALMAIAYLKMGDTERGERELLRALENAQREQTRSMYQAKLTMFGH